MIYKESFFFLKKKVNYTDDIISLDKQTEVRNYDFNSLYYNVLSGNECYSCTHHNRLFSETEPINTAIESINPNMVIPDANIKENRNFRYHILKPSNTNKTGKSTEVILFFHGFNEKYWDKYLPWAKKIADETGKLVVLFPIAFHMNRAPHLWSDARKMFELSQHRKAAFPDLIDSSLSNVAISTRLHACPQRFLWSGLQTYFDVIQFVEDCKAGNHPLIDPGFTIDFFSYSIGSLLAEILKLTNYNNYFENSKLVMFCGGAVFNRLSPVSKFIIDSEANVAMYSYLVEHFRIHMERSPRMAHFLGELHPEGEIFRCMLNYSFKREYRESLFRKMAPEILAITLEKDTVIPPFEVVNTLQGSRRDIPTKVLVLDFPYEYRHEDPFPLSEPISGQVDDSFNKVFRIVTDFFNK
ncbi:MAG: DUF6051 family protein [Bacteroidota bacterium]